MASGYARLVLEPRRDRFHWLVQAAEDRRSTLCGATVGDDWLWPARDERHRTYIGSPTVSELCPACMRAMAGLVS